MNFATVVQNIDLTPLFQAIITILGLVITLKVKPWLETKLTESQFNYLKSATRSAVFAAEQLYGAGKGTEKLQYVIGKLEEKGFTVDPDVIEEYVYELTHGTQEIFVAPLEPVVEDDSEEDDVPLISEEGYK